MTSTTVGAREKALFCQTLAPLIQGLVSRQVIVEMKNEIVIHGKLESVDCFMNLTLRGVKMVKGDGETAQFESFFLQSRNLRYIRIPDDVNIKKTLSEEFEKASGEKSRDLRRKQKEKRSNWLLKKEQKVMPDS